MSFFLNVSIYFINLFDVIHSHSSKHMKNSIIGEITDNMILKMFVLTGLVSLYQSKHIFMPNLPMGEYRVTFDKVYPCESTKDNSIKFNLYINKKTSSIKEFKGNITYLIPFDDTLTFDLNVATWGLTGGWIPNSYIIVTKKACSYVKNILGNAWFSFIKDFNVLSDDCPIPVGIYITAGFDLKKFDAHSFPKVYFYGKYKWTMRLKNVENIVVGCFVIELNIIRPWETPI